jgi:ABC-type bacteriocin/lantibiotic exporter with double-glycine peptidase domain
MNDLISNQETVTLNFMSLLGISRATESIGFRTKGATIIFDQLQRDVQLPSVLHWNQNEIVVYDLFYHYHHSSLAEFVRKITNYYFNNFCNILL